VDCLKTLIERAFSPCFLLLHVDLGLRPISANVSIPGGCGVLIPGTAGVPAGLPNGCRTYLQKRRHRHGMPISGGMGRVSGFLAIYVQGNSIFVKVSVKARIAPQLVREAGEDAGAVSKLAWFTRNQCRGGLQAARRFDIKRKLSGNL
jgi:hypothetical protein